MSKFNFLVSYSIYNGKPDRIYGVSFQRFPCRFHNVIFSSGMDARTEKWVSEEQMKKEF